jgi:toxin HigB-1
LIRSFKCKDTMAIWKGEAAKKLPMDIQSVIRRKLRMLHAAQGLDELRSPLGNRLETLVGDRSGSHSIRVNNRWRICFIWCDGYADDVEVVDYH